MTHHPLPHLKLIAHADVAIVLVQPSPVDLWATVHISGIAKEARAENPNLNAFLVLNQLEPRTTLSRVMQGAMGQLGFPALPTVIEIVYSIVGQCMIVAYAEMKPLQKLKPLLKRLLNCERDH